MLNKEQFLSALGARLSGMPKADLERTLQYYREMIDDRVEDGMTEFEAVADVGDPDELAAAILNKPLRRTAIRTAETPKPPKAPKERRPMSAGKKAALIVCACLLICAGVGLIIASMSMKGRNAVVMEYNFASAEIASLEIDSGSAEVEINHTSGDICRVVCAGDKGRPYKVTLDDGTLCVQRVNNRPWFPVTLKEDSIRIYLPAREYESLWVHSASGGVSVPEGFRFDNAIITASSGGVTFASDTIYELNIQTSSGGVAVKNASPENLFISASSGGVALSGMAPGRVSLNSTSGSLKLDGIRCGGDLSAEVSSGSIRLSDVITDGAMTLECTSGSIKLDDCDAAELYIRSTSGSVSGHLLTPKIYSASAVSGSIRVPTGGSGGICDVKTTSGSIHFD
jgi:DUF4097 and DUF4098 domain-containing protein YvlB